jgi:hypothetical protein
MERRGREYLLYSLFAGCLALLLGSSAVMLSRVPFDTRELDTARSRWAARPFSHYRLELEYGALGYCRQTIEVQHERVVAELQNTCSEPALTVSALFDRIANDIARLNGRCGPNGCECDGTIVVKAAYDARLGYPRTKRLDLNTTARWAFPEYWRHRLAGGICTSRELIKDVITVRALTPIS